MAVRPKVGDVVEFKTSRGYAYALHTHRHPQFGAMLRVWNEEHPKPLRDFASMASVRPSFSTFTPLGAMINQSLAKVVGNIAVPAELTKFPTFRAGVPDPATNKVDTWWLWDGDNEWRVGEITPEQRKFPIRGVWNYTLLMDRIEAGWTPETDRW
jgi:hypothetical protein